MRHTRRILPFLLLGLLLLGQTGPAAADYLGPNRTRTAYALVTYTAEEWLMARWSDNQIVCTFFSAIPPEANNPPQGTCTPDDFTILADTPPCYGDPTLCPGVYGQLLGPASWQEALAITVTDPPATVTSFLYGCALQNGWCTGDSMLTITGSEPVAGYGIQAIEGARNGQVFACPAASCDVLLLEGANDFTYWALSSYGDSSTMGVFSAQVDTRPPLISALLSGTPGQVDWWLSPAQVDLAAEDPAPGSGLVTFEYALDGAAWTPVSGPLTLADGAHSLQLRAADTAGLAAVTSLSVRVDTQAPQVSAAWAGTFAATGWYLSPVTLTISADDPLPGSGLDRLEYSLNGGAWTVLPPTFTLGDGAHALDLRALDAAGNQSTIFGLPLAQVDTIPPAVSLPAAWDFWDAAQLSAGDQGSGLESLTIAILDPSGAHPARIYSYPGPMVNTGLHWDRRFGDGVVALPGTYPVLAEAVDRAGNGMRVSAFVAVPVAAPVPAPGPTATLTAPVAGPTPAPTATRVPPPSSTPRPTAVIAFGLTLPPAPATRTEPSRPAQLWGAAALTAIAALTAALLRVRAARRAQESRQREQTEASAARYNANQSLLRRLRALMPADPKPAAGPSRQTGRPHQRRVTALAKLRKAAIGLIASVVAALTLTSLLGGGLFAPKQPSVSATRTVQALHTQAVRTLQATLTAMAWTPTRLPTGTPHSPPTPTSAPVICTHTVASGQTLSAIASAYRISPADLLAVNRIADPNLLYIGQILALPPMVSCLPQVDFPAQPQPSIAWDGTPRGPLENYFITGWEHGDDEHGCGSIPDCTPMYHPGLDIADVRDATMRANVSGQVWLYQYYRDPDGLHVIKDYDPAAAVAPDQLAGFGNFAVLETWIDGVKYCQVFAHMNSFAADLRSGDAIASGTVIGQMGSTGNSTGAHVHWEVRTESGCAQADNNHFLVYYPTSQERLDASFVDPEEFLQIVAFEQDEGLDVPGGQN